MKVFLTGASGVMGRSATTALVAAGHEVVGLVRSERAARVAEAHGARPHRGTVFDVDAMAAGMQGCDAVVNFAGRMPVGLAMLRPGAWRQNDRIRAVGSRRVAEAMLAAGVPRLVQQSRSSIYADGGDAWIDELAPVEITRDTDTVAEAEQHARALGRRGRDVVVLRFGQIVGPDPGSRWLLRRARSGRPTGWGEPSSWVHLVHVDDVGTAAEAALTAPAGVYNVGAEPCRREDLAEQLALAGGRRGGRFHHRVTQRLAGVRLETFGRSQRVTSQRFGDRAGWHPMFPKLTPDWFDGVL
ncbi:nucleoside-diphosphate-sugar epimerase [Aeromicrobium sp. SORGH_AS981]|uniref:NAD-dependent epimerase/dehydratase family protein n=1 Tax=Aeromicrobium sp. SORGH_AS_0981 TaxID=3041802 RepID=UPI002860CF63|nr:NAD(P)-dependent oxidoreductase [Aeromicrobium sp. SORGH_AS_0981]MDR6116831.1 nucleoside-diphosphate-sugar epimerase [Aeromicrobium sp. SORGH_AS_0981]